MMYLDNVGDIWVEIRPVRNLVLLTDGRKVKIVGHDRDSILDPDMASQWQLKPLLPKEFIK